LSEELAELGYVVASTGDPRLIPEMLRTFEPDLMILAPYMSGEMHRELLERIKIQKPHLLILLTFAKEMERTILRSFQENR
jgi:DNA-binding NarL/FixJ family response regulator